MNYPAPVYCTHAGAKPPATVKRDRQGRLVLPKAYVPGQAYSVPWCKDSRGIMREHTAESQG